MSLTYKVWDKSRKLISQGGILTYDPPDEQMVADWNNLLLTRYPNAATILIRLK